MSINQQLELLRRGAAEIIPEPELAAKLQRSAETGRPLRVKLGVDPTARDVTLGWAVVLRKLRQFQDLGHEACLIIGDFTAQIGDPTGKSKTRVQLTPDEVAAHARACEQQLYQILDPARTRLFCNSDWLGKMTFADVINLGAKYTVARLLEREDFAKRLRENRPLHVHEILYPLCQGYDSVAIEADIEMGGMDQKFNNLVGRELQREFGQEPQVVFLMPLLVGTDGVEKMSQSLGNYVGIQDEPTDMYGKLMSIPDDAMRQYFELCTAVPMEEVGALLKGHLKQAKMRLAREIVTIYHGAEAAQNAEAEFERVFSHKDLPTEIPEVQIAPDRLAQGNVWIVDLLRDLKLVQSGGEARRLLSQKAVEIDGQVINDLEVRVAVRDGMVVRVGKRRFARVRVR